MEHDSFLRFQTHLCLKGEKPIYLIQRSINMSSKYRFVKSEGQEDKNACWAASLVWWLRATKLKNVEQWEIMSSDEYSSLWNIPQGGDGTITEAGLMTIVNDARWGMSHQKLSPTSQLDPAVMRAHLNFGPVYVGFFDVTRGGNHVNVIYDINGNEADPQVSVMEPGWVKKKDGTFKGKHVSRRLSYYKNGAAVILASPQFRLN